MRSWVLSVDLGQSIDPTAVSVIERSSRWQIVKDYRQSTPDSKAGDPGSPPVEWFRGEEYGFNDLTRLKNPSSVGRLDVRYLERLPLGTSYPHIVSHVGSLLRRAPLDYPRADLLVDMTGVGRPVVDMFRAVGLRPIGVTITAGEKESRTQEGDYRVAKLQLVSRLQAALHSGELRIAKDLREAKTLVSELQDFRASFGDTGYASFNAREGAHDDLVLAVAIGAWWASRPRTPSGLGEFVIA
jgi:hypothetical protein